MAAPAARGRHKTAVLARASAGTQVIEAAVAGQRISVIYVALTVDATTAKPSFEGSSGTGISGVFDQAANEALILAGTRLDPLFWTAVGEGLTFRTGGVGVAAGFITYLVEESL